MVEMVENVGITIIEKIEMTTPAERARRQMDAIAARLAQEISDEIDAEVIRDILNEKESND